MNSIETFETISKHRPQLMLLAMLWVIVFHFTPPYLLTSFNIFQSIGCGGVDIFMFLSGFGLCCSYYNSFADILWQLTCFGFWVGKPSYDWYVPSILLLYFAFPFFVRLSKRYGIQKCVGVASLIGLLPTALFIYLGKGTWISFTARIPLFFMGCYTGYMLTLNKKIAYPGLLMLISICVLVVELVLASMYDYDSMHRMGFYYLPQILIVPGVCLLLASLLDKIPNKILAPFNILGSMTLEIYLVHMSMRIIHPESMFLIPILIAIVLHYSVKYLTNKIFTSIAVKS